jgi:hypothetical protein
LNTNAALAPILCYAATNKPNQRRNGREIMDYKRRTILTAAGAAVAMVATSRQLFAGWEPSERYPDPAVQALDPSFAKYRLLLAGVERLAVGMRWSEGPVWFGDGATCCGATSPTTAS